MLEIDGSCQFEEFCAQIEQDGNLKKQLATAMARMDQVANLQRLPVQKFRDITPTKETVKEFEIKTPDLRIYLIKEKGHIIILGGKKNTEGDDIKSLDRLNSDISRAKNNTMFTREELLKTPEYWFEQAQDELYRQVTEFMEKERINQTQLAEKLGVSKGYISQVMKGEFNYTLKKLIELAMAVGKIPTIEYKGIEQVVKEDSQSHFLRYSAGNIISLKVEEQFQFEHQAA
jgi:predicted XRE-type DNA-binding protein